ncbi:GntR family transcriptional regulator [Cryptosporangium sp. NPDC051539]|uniref:GntR family transcriptional regulator n=1 Tax=Cryptosporangium sp. NPDC051539 TaxID=3363962 RepID=UPI00378FCEFE
MASRKLPSAAAPRYIAIAGELRDRITTEKLAPHTLIPSERELSDQYGVSRMTARHALSLLENEYVYRRPPRGTFVAEPRVQFHIGSFSDEITRVGRRPAAQVVWAEEREPSPSAREALDLAPGATVHALHRLRFADDEPIALETTYFPSELTPGLLQQPLTGSLWEVLRRQYAIVPTDARATIQSIVIDDASCARLEVRGASPGILITRWTHDEPGRCIEFARDVYRADRASFEVEARIPVPLDE